MGLSIIPGAAFHFAPYNGTTVLKTAIPSVTGLDYDSTAAPWVLLNKPQGVSISPNAEKETLTACVGSGLRTDIKEVVKKQSLTLNFELGEIGQTVLELVFATSLTAGAGTPLSTSAQKEGWLRMELFDEAAGSVGVFCLYGNLSIDGALDMQDSFAKPKLAFKVLNNSAATIAASAFVA